MNRFRAWLSDRLATIGGADTGALQIAGTTRGPFVAIGSTLLVTAMVAVISMLFALHDAVDINWAAAVPVALAWGLVIFTLDRMLISVSMGSGVLATIGTTLVRLAVAVLIGFIVSTPLTMRAFSSDIALQLGEMRLENAAKIQTQIDEQKKLTVDPVQADIAVQNNIVQGVLPPELDTTDGGAVQAAQQAVDALQPQLQTAQHTAEQAAILVNCEGYGNGRELLDEPDRCAKVPGKNGNYDRYVRESEQAAARLAEIQAQVDAAQARVDAAKKAQAKDHRTLLHDLQAQAPAELASLKQRLADAEAAITDLKDQLDEVNKGNDGLLARLEALSRAGHDKPMLHWAHLLLALLFIAIEMAPVLGKTMFSFGKRAATYEQALALVDASDLNLAHLRLTLKADIEEARLRGEAESEIRLQEDFLRRVEDVMRARGHRDIAAWEASLP